MMFLIFIDELAKLLEHHGVTAKLFADHALGQPMRQASALTHERRHVSPHIVNRELFADDIKVYLIITTVLMMLQNYKALLT